jgi:hypothetical protein
MTGSRFEIAREIAVEGSPEDLFDAVTDHTGGWLWPDTVEHAAGGSTGSGGTVTVGDPPRQFSSRMEGADGWFNQLDFTVLAKADGTWLRYVHSGVFTDDWEAQYDGAAKHTDFYLHTLGQYVQHFAGRTAVYVDVLAPSASQTADGLDRLLAALQLGSAARDTTVDVPLPTGETRAVVDYRNDWFVGLRTDTSLVRIFGRNFFGAPVAVAVHSFTDTPADDLTAAWRTALDSIYA